MYLFISIIVLFCSYKLFKKASGDLSFTKLNMISWIFYYNLILQSFFAAIIVVYKLDFHYMISKISTDAPRLMGFYAIMYTMIAMPIGMIICNKFNFSGFTNTLYIRYLNSDVVYESNKYKEPAFYFTLSLLSGLSILSIIYIFISIGKFPLLSALMGNSSNEELGLLRAGASRGFQGVVYIKNIFGLLLTPILSYIYYAYYRLTGKRKLKIWYIVMTTFSILIITYNLEKSPVIQYLLGFLFLKILLSDKINLWLLLKYFIIVLSLLILTYVFVLSEDVSRLFSYNTGFIGRILLGQSTGTFLMFDMFPNYSPHIGISSISGLLNSLLDLEPSQRAARLVMEMYNPYGVDLGTAGVINSLFVAEAWANFGIMGVVLGPIYVGFVIQFLFLFFLKRKKTPIMLGILAYLSYRLPVTGGFNDFIYSTMLLSIFVLFSFIFSWSYKIIRNG